MLSIHFDMQGHGNQISALEVRNCRKSGDKVTEPKKPETEGYTFGGLYKDAACTIAWNFETDTVTTYTVLFAKWTENQPDEERIDLKPIGAIASIKAKIYDGYPYEPVVKVRKQKEKTLTEGADYRVLYHDNTACI